MARFGEALHSAFQTAPIVRGNPLLPPANAGNMVFRSTGSLNERQLIYYELSRTSAINPVIQALSRQGARPIVRKSTIFWHVPQQICYYGTPAGEGPTGLVPKSPALS